MPKGKFAFTSEAVSQGHPDKLADQISDGILDALIAKDPLSRVACETMVTTGIAIVAGEITTQAADRLSRGHSPGHPRGGLHRRSHGHLRRYLRNHALAGPAKSRYRDGRE